MSPRLRVWLVVGAAAAAAAGIAVGVTLATRSDVSRPASRPPPFASDPTAPAEVAKQVREALRAWPGDPETLTAAAVGLYDKDRPAAAFSRLGPLVRRFPHAQTVRFHLGLLLIYFGDVARARRELVLARAQGPLTSLGKRAETLLKAARKR